MKKIHMMLDLETFGHTSNSVIESVSAVKFTDSAMLDEIYLPLNIDEQVFLGQTISQGTLLWWFGQSKKARKIVVSAERIDLTPAFVSLGTFCQGVDFVWGNAARFDCGLLIDLERKYKRQNDSDLWQFRQEKCYRTVMNTKAGREIKKAHVFEGTPHVGIDDCKNQIHQLWKLAKKQGGIFE